MNSGAIFDFLVLTFYLAAGRPHRLISLTFAAQLEL